MPDQEDPTRHRPQRHHLLLTASVPDRFHPPPAPVQPYRCHRPTSQRPSQEQSNSPSTRNCSKNPGTAGSDATRNVLLTTRDKGRKDSTGRRHGRAGQGQTPWAPMRACGVWGGAWPWSCGSLWKGGGGCFAVHSRIHGKGGFAVVSRVYGEGGRVYRCSLAGARGGGLGASP